MGSCCSVGARPDAAEIDAALRSGGPENSIRRVVSRFWTHDSKLSYTAIQRHREHVLDGPAVGVGRGAAAADPPDVACATESPDESPSESLADGPGTVAIEVPKPTSGPSRARMKPLEKSLIQPPVPWDESPEPDPDSGDVDPLEFPPLPDDRIGRVMVVEDLMLDLHWVTGKTGKQLARFWGVSEDMVAKYAGEASRNIKRNVDPQQVKDRLATSLRRGLDMALASNELKALAGIAKAQGEIVGLLVGAKVQINISQEDFGRGTGAFLRAAAPELVAEYGAWCAAVCGGDQAAMTDPGRWLLARRNVVETTAEEV